MKSRNKELLKYIGPGIIGLLFNSLYIIVDGIFVAKMLGSNALAAVTVVVPIVEILIAVSLMISIGCGIYISSSKGKEDIKLARSYFNHGFDVTIVVSIVITFIFLIFNKHIVTMLGATEDIFDETRSYFLWFTVFIPFFVMNYSLGTWIRNDGKPNLAMAGQVIGAILNIILDYMFMGPLNMGIKGAAIATGLGPVVGIIILLPHFLGKKGDLYLEKTKFEFKKIKQIFAGGLPSFAIEFSLGIMTFFYNLFISYRFKELGLSAFGVIGYINLMILSIYLGIGQGTQPLISLYQGQKSYEKIEEVYKVSLKIAVFVGFFGYLILYLTKATVTSIFIDKTNIELTNLTLAAINLFFIGLPLTGINVITASIFEAKRNIFPSIFISFSRSVLFLLPILFILNKLNNPMMLWLGASLAELITLFISTYLWRMSKKIES